MNPPLICFRCARPTANERTGHVEASRPQVHLRSLPSRPARHVHRLRLPVRRLHLAARTPVNDLPEEESHAQPDPCSPQVGLRVLPDRRPLLRRVGVRLPSLPVARTPVNAIGPDAVNVRAGYRTALLRQERTMTDDRHDNTPSCQFPGSLHRRGRVVRLVACQVGVHREARRARAGAVVMTGILHTVGFWQSLLSAFGRDLRALCGASLTCAGPEDDPGPDAPPCPQCAARNAAFANTSWNCAIVSLAACLAVFLASVIATTAGWHAAVTGWAAAASAVALAGCGVWLHLAAARLEPLEPEDDDEPDGGES